jgi:3-dehydroquinate synthase
MAGTASEEVRLDLGPRSYPIVVGDGILDEVGPRLAELGFRGRCALVTSERVSGLYGPAVLASLRGAGLRPAVIEVPDGEEHKNLAWLTFLYDRLIDAKLDRQCAVIALGGGVIGDLAGFVAATFARGLTFVQVPTTLLAQVDSSVGGKVGVNLPGAKNMVGAFWQPKAVLIDTQTLQTLPEREYRSGLAEVIKYGIIHDAALFARIERDLPKLLRRDAKMLADIVARRCELKAAAQCSGNCTGKCVVEAGAMCDGEPPKCTGQCTGHCEGSCTGNVTPPSASVDCMATAECDSTGLDRCRL